MNGGQDRDYNKWNTSVIICGTDTPSCFTKSW